MKFRTTEIAMTCETRATQYRATSHPNLSFSPCKHSARNNHHFPTALRFTPSLLRSASPAASIMVSRKEMARDDAVPMATRPPPLPASKLPAPLRFPLLVILSLSSSFFLYTFFSGFMGNELAAVSRTVNENWQVASLLGWKILELGIGWYGNFDGKPRSFSATYPQGNLPPSIANTAQTSTWSP